MKQNLKNWASIRVSPVVFAFACLLFAGFTCEVASFATEVITFERAPVYPGDILGS
jgi:hypothetical protein